MAMKERPPKAAPEGVAVKYTEKSKTHLTKKFIIAGAVTLVTGYLTFTSLSSNGAPEKYGWDKESQAQITQAISLEGQAFASSKGQTATNLYLKAENIFLGLSKSAHLLKKDSAESKFNELAMDDVKRITTINISDGQSRIQAATSPTEYHEGIAIIVNADKQFRSELQRIFPEKRSGRVFSVEIRDWETNALTTATQVALQNLQVPILEAQVAQINQSVNTATGDISAKQAATKMQAQVSMDTEKAASYFKDLLSLYTQLGISSEDMEKADSRMVHDRRAKYVPDISMNSFKDIKAISDSLQAGDYKTAEAIYEKLIKTAQEAYEKALK